MPDYIPPFDDANANWTMTAGAAINGGELVYVSGARTVQKTAGVTAAWLGIATQDAASGAKVGVTSSGIQEPIASGAIAAGDLVVPAASGRVSTLAAVTTPTAADVTNTRAIVGVALTGAADGAKVLVRFER